MKATVFDERGIFQAAISELANRFSTDSFFWLDIDGASREEVQRVASVLQIAEPASSWLPRFGQRARFEVDGQQIRISTFAAGVSGQPIEAHILYTHSWLLTVHAGAANTMERALESRLCAKLMACYRFEITGDNRGGSNVAKPIARCADRVRALRSSRGTADEERLTVS